MKTIKFGSLWTIVMVTIIRILPVTNAGSNSLSRLKDDDNEDKLFLEKVWDPSCKHPDDVDSIYEYGYDFDEINKTSLFRKDFKLGSYVGFPCNVALYNEYKTKFMLPGLTCPFEGYLDYDFQTFVFEKLWTKGQTIPGNITVNGPTSLLFQYICFSSQKYERCEPDPEIKAKNGSCDGICKCMSRVPVDNATGYPEGLSPEKNDPKLELENKIRCGVKANGLCIPTWHPNCKFNKSATYNDTLEHSFKQEDFYLQCESNAGCHSLKKICECAQGHDCKDEGDAGGNMIHCDAYGMGVIILGIFYILEKYGWFVN